MALGIVAILVWALYQLQSVLLLVQVRSTCCRRRCAEIDKVRKAVELRAEARGALQFR